jgi:glucose 1-dehydrogenase
MRGLEGRTALVTGGSSGIGQAIAIRLGQEGVNVAVNFVGRPEGAEATKDAIERGVDHCVREVEQAGARALVVEADVSDEQEVERMFKTVSEELGTVDLLVNNAGIQVAQPSDVLEPGAFDRVLSVNLRGSFLCAQEAIRRLLAEQRPGSIVNVSSVYGLLSPVQDLYAFRRERGETFVKPVAYSVSKSAILNLTRYLATYWAKDGVRVNTLTLAGVWNDQPPEFLEAYKTRVPLGRMLEASEALGAVVFLASDASSYVTGSNVVVDGGWSAW